eukprot:2620312-Amphidinium_carterae.4
MATAAGSLKTWFTSCSLVMRPWVTCTAFLKACTRMISAYSSFLPAPETANEGWVGHRLMYYLSRC